MVKAPFISMLTGVAGAVLIGVILFGYLIYRLRSSVDDNDTNEDSGAERLDNTASRKESLGLRKKIGFLPGPAKFALLLTLIAGARLSYEAYVFFKTGSPTQFLTSQLAENTIIFMIAIGVGLVYERKRTTREGLLSARVEKEPDNGGDIQTKDVEFRINPKDTDTCEEGTILYAYTKHRVMGLYRRPKSIIEDRRTRENPQPPGDKIGILLPEEDVSDHDRFIHVRCGGIETVEDPERPYDLKFASSPRLSIEKREQLRTDKEVLREERDQIRVRLAAAHKSLMALREADEQALERRLDDVKQVLKEVGDYIGPSRATFQHTQRGASHTQRPNTKQNGHDSDGDIENLEQLQEILD